MTNQTVPQNDNRFWDPLRRLGAILAIFPPCRFVKPDHNKTQYFYRCFTIFMLWIILIGSGFGIVGLNINNYRIYRSSTLRVTDTIVALSITATNVVAILAPSIWYLNKFVTFCETLEKTENCLQKCKSVKVKLRRTLYIELTVSHIVLFLLFMADAYIWITTLGFIQYRYYIFRNFQCYHMFITIATIYNFALSMQYRFEMINSDLKNINDLPSFTTGTFIQLQVMTEKFEAPYSVRQLGQQYESLIKQIALFNNIFGWQILFMTLSIMMGLLNSLNILTVFLTLEERENGIPDVKFGYGLIILNAVWALWQLFLGAAVTVPCSSTVKAAQQTVDLCFSILLKLPVIPTNVKEKGLQNELYLLKDLAVNRYPTFSAAGFFAVDYSMFLAVFASVTSYVIVLIQFNK